jgi:amino acid transporter
VGVPGAILCYVPVAALNGVTGVAVVALYGFVAAAAIFARRGAHKTRQAWRMPLWPAVPVVLLAVLVWVLTQQATRDLLITGGITVAAAVYFLAYLRPRRETHSVITVPDEE